MSYVADTNAALVFFVAKYAVTTNVAITVKAMVSANLMCFFTVSSNV